MLLRVLSSQIFVVYMTSSGSFWFALVCKWFIGCAAAVYTFPPSLPEATPTLPESPALTPPEPHATDGPPPSSPLPPLLNNTSPSPDSPTPSQAPAQETPTAAVVSAAAVAAAPSPGLAETLPAPTSFSEPAVAPSFSAVPAAPAPSKLLAAAPAASASSAAPTEPAASTATPLTNLAAAQLSVPAPTLIPGNSTITSSLESSSTADASLSLSSVTAAAQNLSAEPLVLTQDGVMYDLKGIASNGSCLTLWQLIQLSPNLTSWAYTIQAMAKASCSETGSIFGLVQQMSCFLIKGNPSCSVPMTVHTVHMYLLEPATSILLADFLFNSCLDNCLVNSHIKMNFCCG